MSPVQPQLPNAGVVFLSFWCTLNHSLKSPKPETVGYLTICEACLPRLGPRPHDPGVDPNEKLWQRMAERGRMGAKTVLISHARTMRLAAKLPTCSIGFLLMVS